MEAADQHALGPERPEEEKGKQQCNVFTRSKGDSLGQAHYKPTVTPHFIDHQQFHLITTHI